MFSVRAVIACENSWTITNIIIDINHDIKGTYITGMFHEEGTETGKTSFTADWEVLFIIVDIIEIMEPTKIVMKTYPDIPEKKDIALSK